MATRRRDPGEAILEAASRLLADEGPHALTVRRIATEAGGSTMNVYSRFGGKEGVVEALFVEGFRRLKAAMEAAGTTDDPLADLDACGRAYRDFGVEHPTYYGIMFEGAVSDFEPSEQAGTEAFGTLMILAAKIERAMDAGRFARQDPLPVALSFWALVHGQTSLARKHTGPVQFDWAAAHDAAFHAMCRGFAAEARPPGSSPDR